MRGCRSSSARIALCALLAYFLCASQSRAQIIVVDRDPGADAASVVEGGPLRLKLYRSRVEITDGQVRTTVSETFFNSTPNDRRGYYVFRIGNDARGIRLLVNGTEVAGVVLEGDEAASALEEAGESGKHAPGGVLQAFVASLPAHSVVNVELTYTRTLTASLATLLHEEPLALCRDAWASDARVAIQVDLKTPLLWGPINAAAAEARIELVNDRHVRVVFERAKPPEHDWQLRCWPGSGGGNYRGPGDVVPPNLSGGGDSSPPGNPGGPGTPGAGAAPSTGRPNVGTGGGAFAGFEDWSGAEVLVIATGGASEPEGEGPGATQGQLQARDPSGKIVGEFPLEHTDVSADITGFLASTHVHQRFGNPFTQPMEAVYVFPLPCSAAVHDFVMQVGERKIIGLIRPRQEAERIYAEAKDRGQTVSMLSQERTNVFTQSVANIEPRGQVDIEITYSHALSYEGGQFEYVFPMVVGPRYIPGASATASSTESIAVGARPAGGGIHPNTHQVADASRITPPLLRPGERPGERSGHDVSLEVSLDAGVYLRDVRCPTHDVSVEPTGVDRVRVRLAETDRIANRDFVLRYAVAGDNVELGLLAHRSELRGGFFTLMMVPPLDAADQDVTPREVTFIVDSSGSMRGLPIEMSKEVVRRTLLRLRPFDRFNIIQFSGGTSRLADAPIANTSTNVARGLAYLESFTGSGGTEMLKAVEAYLETKADPAYLRIVCFLTDGFVGNEDAIHALIRDRGQGARWFAFGIGSSVNRMLIDGIAHHGNGAASVVLPRDRSAGEKAVLRFLSLIDAPVLVDVSLDFGNLPVAEVLPARPRDLFTGEPITIVGRYLAGATGEVTVRGRVGTRRREFRLPVTLPELAPDHEVLAPVWARAKVADLSEHLLGNGQDPTTIGAITSLALEFRLVTAFTSFVAVDESRVVGNGQPLRILQPVELPEGVSREGVGGASVDGLPRRVGAWGMLLTERQGHIIVRHNGGAQQDDTLARVLDGDVLVSVDRTLVRDLEHLESLLLQGSGPTVVLTLRDAGEVVAARP